MSQSEEQPEERSGEQLRRGVNCKTIDASIHQLHGAGKLTVEHLRGITSILGVDLPQMQALGQDDQEAFTQAVEAVRNFLATPGREPEATDLILIFILLQRSEAEVIEANILFERGLDKNLLFYHLGSAEQRGDMSISEIAMALGDFGSRCYAMVGKNPQIQRETNNAEKLFERYQKAFDEGSLQAEEGKHSWFRQIQEPTYVNLGGAVSVQVELPPQAIRVLVLKYLHILIENPTHLGKPELQRSGLVWIESLVDISKLRETVRGNPIFSAEDRDYLLTALDRKGGVRLGGSGRAALKAAQEVLVADVLQPSLSYPNEARISYEGLERIAERIEKGTIRGDIINEHLDLICALLGINQLQGETVEGRGDNLVENIRKMGIGEIDPDRLCLIDLFLGIDKSQIEFMRGIYTNITASAQTPEDMPKAVAKIRDRVTEGEFEDKMRCNELIEKAELLRRSEKLRGLHLIIIAHLIKRNDLCDRLKAAKGETKEVKAVFDEITRHIQEHASGIGLEIMHIIDFMLDLNYSEETKGQEMRNLYQTVAQFIEEQSFGHAVAYLHRFIHENRASGVFRRKPRRREEPSAAQSGGREEDTSAVTETRFRGIDFRKLHLDQEG